AGHGCVLGLPGGFRPAGGVVHLVGPAGGPRAPGLKVRGIGMGSRAARLAGVNRRGLLFAVYIASGTLAAVAGVFASASVMTVDVSNTGYQLELDAILAVVIVGSSLV